MDFARRSATVCFIILGAFSFLLPPLVQAAASNSPAFSKNLRLWDTGTSVHTLEVFLNSNGYLIAQSGPGSLGHETTTFGPKTLRSLKQFQATHDLPATGFFGPLTRAAANSTLSSAASSTAVAPAPSPTVPTPLTPPIYTTPPPTPAIGQPWFAPSGGGSGGGPTPAPTPGPTPDTTPPSVSPTLSVTNSPVTYTGSAQSATVTGSVAGTVSSVKYNGSATVPTAAGTYAITANFAPTDSTDYSSLTAASAGNFVISQAAPTLSVTNSPVTYTGSAQSATVTGSVAGTVSSVAWKGIPIDAFDLGLQCGKICGHGGAAARSCCRSSNATRCRLPTSSPRSTISPACRARRST
jgi:peptidoglycan hydrolase-like protein with peptidoglycan-binding domain